MSVLPVSVADVNDTHRRRGSSGYWLLWILGAAILAAVVVAAFRLSEGRAFVAIAEGAKPWWLVLAVCLQGGTYMAQAEIFRGAPRVSGHRLPLAAAYELSLAKLFIDQALPSAGISSIIVVAKALERRCVPRMVVAASIVINMASYHSAYVICLIVALAITTAHGRTYVPVLLVSVLFMAFSVVVTTGILLLSGRDVDRIAAKLQRFPALRNAVVFLKDADPRLTKSLPLLSEAVAWQTAIFLLDGATIWVLIQSCGATASTDAVFASFMISSVFRTVGIVPGGLGTFEATSVVTLNMMGVAVPIALAATLLFRGLSFWLPMLPGVWVARRLTVGPVAPGQTDS